MNNLSSYCGLTDSKMRASDTDLPVKNCASYLKKNNRQIRSDKSGLLTTDNDLFKERPFLLRKIDKMIGK